MIKGQYFAHFEIWENGHVKISLFRQFWVSSLFRKYPGTVLNDKISKIAKEFNVDIDSVHVTAFNNIK